MRLKPGRPDLNRWADLVDVPGARPASPGVALRVAWLGVSTLHVTDGTSSLLTDGFFSRPGLVRTGLGRIRPDEARIDHALRRAGIDTLEAVLPVHTHYDHVLDSATVAARTGARVIGGESAAHVARGHGLPEGRIRVVTSGDELKLVHPQPGAGPELFEHLDFTWFCLQPMDGPDRVANTEATVAACLARPRWRLSLQTHKELGIP